MCLTPARGIPARPANRPSPSRGVEDRHRPGGRLAARGDSPRVQSHPQADGSHAADRPQGREAGPSLRDAPVAQGIERCPAEAEVARSNRAGRMAQPCGFWMSEIPKEQAFDLRSLPPSEEDGAYESCLLRAGRSEVLGFADR